nr:putative reverse transcriptase domain-containing protein [Tanacetum cinerariifolium]
MKQGWCGQAYKDLLWRSASATSVKEFEKCRVKSDLLLNNICEVFNGKIVRDKDKPVITLLQYISEYCMNKIVNVQSVIDKCTGPLTPTITRIIKSIKKEAHFMKVQWNGANKYQVSGSFGDRTTPRSVGKSLILVDYMEGNILSQGGNNAEASDSASRQAHQTNPTVGQDGSGGRGVGDVIVLSAADG